MFRKGCCQSKGLLELAFIVVAKSCALIHFESAIVLYTFVPGLMASEAETSELPVWVVADEQTIKVTLSRTRVTIRVE